MNVKYDYRKKPDVEVVTEKDGFGREYPAAVKMDGRVLHPAEAADYAQSLLRAATTVEAGSRRAKGYI